MSPAGVLREALAGARREGASFEAAWSTALESALAAAPDRAERDAWRAALAGMVGVWRRAFEGTPATAGEQAAAMLADREPGLELPHRPCAYCGEPLSSERDRRARFCGEHCRRESVLERKRLGWTKRQPARAHAA